MAEDITISRVSNTDTCKELITRKDKIKKYIKAATADNTRKAYRSAILQFERWGGRLPADANVIVQYLLDRANILNTRTIDLHITAISQWHKYQGMSDPTLSPIIKKTMEGIRRLHAKPRQKAKALRPEHIAKMIESLSSSSDLKNIRDRALILIGYFGAFRRSELVNIKVDNIEWEEEGILIKVARSKTDQGGHGLVRAIPYNPNKLLCPPTSLKLWLEVADISDGYIFKSITRWGQLGASKLHDATINTILKKVAKNSGLEFADQLSSHSFRRGLSTSAARENVSFEYIKKQGGWKSDATVWEYIDEGRSFADNPAHKVMKKAEDFFK